MRKLQFQELACQERMLMCLVNTRNLTEQYYYKKGHFKIRMLIRELRGMFKNKNLNERPGVEFQLCPASFSTSASLSEQDTALLSFQGAVADPRTKLSVASQVLRS